MFYILKVSKIGPIAQMCLAIQLISSVVTILVLAIVPPGHFISLKKREDGLSLTNATFTSNFASLKPSEKMLSVGIWVRKNEGGFEII